MRSWSNCKQEIRQAIRSDRLDLTDLLEKLAAAGLRFSDLLRGQTFRLRVDGRSMSTALWNGDQITVEPASTTSLQVGDVILFHQSGQLICHRVVAIQETGAGPRLITKGDAETGCREVIQPDQVLGRVVAVTRRWPWSRSSRWVGALARRIDQATERLTLLLAKWLQSIQTLRGYRWLMRNLLSRCVVVYLDVSEGTRWISYQPASHGGDATLPAGHRDFHLLAKLAGICVGSLQVTASGGGYRIDHLYVRIRYRGLGVGSQLLASAATSAAVSGAHVLLASVEPANTAALRLFTKTGFRKTGGLHGNQISLRRDL